jgi:hypothetical protein
MNQKNYQYLTESLAKLGFGEALNAALKTKMELGFEDFELKAKTQYGTDQIQYALKFEKGKNETEGEKFYFLNQVKATLSKQNEQPLEQEFKLYRQKGYDTKEMYNLLEKRPVYKVFRKEGENVGRWVKLDFTTRDENGNALARPYYDNVTNFNLVREVGKLNLTFANQQEKEDLLRDLRSGDQVSVTIRQNGRNEKSFIGVAPQIGGLILYNSEMKEIRRTNSHNIELVTDDKGIKADKGAQKLTSQESDETLPNTTKSLMEKVNNTEIKEGQQAKRKVS